MTTDPPGRHLTGAAYPWENPVSTPETPPVATPAKSTSEPVLKAAALYGTGAAFVVTALGVLVGVGVLSSAEADAITAAVDSIGAQIVPVGAAVVGVVGLVSGIVSNLVSAFAARRKVTPNDSDAFDVVPKWAGR